VESQVRFLNYRFAHFREGFHAAILILDIKTKGALLMHFSTYNEQVHRRRKKSAQKETKLAKVGRLSSEGCLQDTVTLPALNHRAISRRRFPQSTAVAG
jgi:hypothetical protein